MHTFLPDGHTPSLKAETLEKLRERKLIFCLHDPSDDFSFSPEEFNEWERYIKEPHIVNGKNQSYYTYFGDNLIPVTENKIQLYS